MTVSISSSFFYCYCHNRELHSFPTRRSSDLLGPLLRKPLPQARRPPVHHKAAFSCFLSRIRSEEHTSELQSLRHLVCRLLLEKKKPTGWSRSRCGSGYRRSLE